MDLWLWGSIASAVRLCSRSILVAEEWLVSFLLDCLARHSARGLAAKEFRLRMTREEIGSYLRLKLETISRCSPSDPRLALSVAGIGAFSFSIWRRCIDLLARCVGEACEAGRSGSGSERYWGA